LTFNYNSSYSNGTNFVATLLNGNTTKHDNWSCGIRLFDGSLYSAISNTSYNLTILNTAPNITLTSPDDLTVTTDRTPTFNWTGADSDGDVLQYEFNLSLVAASTCYESNRYVTKNTILSNLSYTPTTYIRCLYDNLDSYNWSARAYDGEEYSSWSAFRTIYVQSLINLSLYNTTVSFGNLNNSQSKNTTSGEFDPFVLINYGNSYTNVSINSTDLWSKVANPSEYYQFKVRNTTMNCFWTNETNTSWAFVPSITSNVIKNFNFTSGYQEGCNNVSFDIHVEVPLNESAGDKSSTITFTGRLGEIY
jgi:hypothetical protein